MTAFHETRVRASVAGWSRASRYAGSSIAHHQHQMGTDTERGQSLALGVCRLALAADDTQDWPVLTLRAGSYVRMMTSDLLPGSISVHLRGRAGSAAPRLFHSTRVCGANRHPRHTLADQKLSKHIAGPLHFHSRPRLSSSVAFAGFEPSEASNGRVPKSCGAFPKKKGEFPNVGC